MSDAKTLLRKDAPKESTWNKEVVYPSWDDWKKEYEQALAELPELGEYNGKITASPAALAEWFEVYDKHGKRAAILTSFVQTSMTRQRTKRRVFRFLSILVFTRIALFHSQ